MNGKSVTSILKLYLCSRWLVAAKQLLLMICGITLLLDVREITVGVYNNYNENKIE